MLYSGSIPKPFPHFYVFVTVSQSIGLARRGWENKESWTGIQIFSWIGWVDIYAFNVRRYRKSKSGGTVRHLFEEATGSSETQT